MADPLDLLDRLVPPSLAAEMFGVPASVFAGIKALTLRSAFLAAYRLQAMAFYKTRCRKRAALMQKIADEKRHRHINPRIRVPAAVAAEAEAGLRARLAQILDDAAAQIAASDPAGAERLRDAAQHIHAKDEDRIISE